jgi:hypothetical protein
VGCGKGKATALLLLPSPGNRGRSSAISAGRPGHRAFFLGTRIEEAAHAPRVGAGAAPPLPNPPPRPASGSAGLTHRLPNTLGQVGEQYGPSIAPFARDGPRCPFLPLLTPVVV